jgi:hypothetical protein
MIYYKTAWLYNYSIIYLTFNELIVKVFINYSDNIKGDDMKNLISEGKFNKPKKPERRVISFVSNNDLIAIVFILWVLLLWT